MSFARQRVQYTGFLRARERTQGALTVARPIIIDTDPGIDDAVAIFLAAASPEVDLLGIISVAGNVGLKHTSGNAAALADLLQLNIPLGKGADGPLWRRDTKPADHVHGANGLGGYALPQSDRVAEPGLELMARLIEESEEPVTLIAIGPLTNVAGLITFYPETARKLERIVLMGGGTLEHMGNVTPAAEFNIYYDPDAAARVFDSGLPITMVGLNVTNTALVGPSHLPGLAGSDGKVADITRHLLSTYRSKVEDNGTAQHDSVAVASVIDPTLIETKLLHVDIDNTGRLTAGQTVVDHEGGSGMTPNIDVALSIDLERFRSLLDTRLTALDTRLRGAAS
nr:nucleoside hydrolase [Leucobacter chinensis]